MSSDILRRAAALMRERAEAATPGPWHVVPEDAAFNASVGTRPADSAEWLESSEWVAESTPRGHRGSENAAHIASWHPGVALRIADWLDTAADDHELRFQHAMCDQRALAVARAYLGEFA